MPEMVVVHVSALSRPYQYVWQSHCKP